MNSLRHLLTYRLRPVDLLVLDAVAAAGAAALCVAAALEAPEKGGPHEPVWLSVLAGAVIGLPVAWRRRRPVAAAAVVTAASAVALLTGLVPDFAVAGPAAAIAIAFYAVGLLTPDRRSLVAGACLAVMSGALAATADELWNGLGAVALGAAMTGPAWVAGWMVRARREHAAQYRAHLVREAAAEERLRVARDLHDIVGHTMSLIAVKASVAVHVAAERPEEALDALRVIEATSRDALLETRRLLGMLRDEDPLGPEDLQALAGRASAAGVEVHLDVPPEVFDRSIVTEPLAGSVYRIVQESLTNVVKHAAPATCRANVAIEPDEVRIEVVDDGRRPPAGTHVGHGLIGMRERAGLHGGSFEAGARPEGGFRVQVRIPRDEALPPKIEPPDVLPPNAWPPAARNPDGRNPDARNPVARNPDARSPDIRLPPHVVLLRPHGLPPPETRLEMRLPGATP